MSWLLDANILIALSHINHTAHARCEAWIGNPAIKRFATTPITENALLRVTLQLNPNMKVEGVLAILESIRSDARHEFWADDVEYIDVNWRGVIGHRQITDAHLAALARARGGRLVTLDRGLAALHPDVAHLLAA